jgi:hypothetical protein
VDTQQCVELTDTNQPCGLTIIHSLAHPVCTVIGSSYRLQDIQLNRSLT